jgi:hypothetical protein
MTGPTPGFHPRVPGTIGSPMQPLSLAREYDVGSSPDTRRTAGRTRK